MKFNYNTNKVKIVDDNIDIINFINKITKKELEENAFFVFDIQDLIQKYYKWEKKLPRVMSYYNVRCNDNLFLLKILCHLGITFNCISKEEIKKLLSLGIDPSRIICGNTTKPPSHIKYVADEGIELTSFDNVDELYKIKKLYPSAKLLLQFRYDQKMSLFSSNIHFSCNSLIEASTLLNTARTLNMEIVGVRFQVGSVCDDPEIFQRAIVMAYNIFELGKSMDFQMKILDIDGGFSGVKGYSIDATANQINETLKKYFPENNNVNIRAEIGRYLVTSAFTLATLIYCKQTISDAVTGLPQCMYYIEDGVYGSFNSLIYDHAKIQPLPLPKKQSREMVSSTIWGPTCDPFDRIVENTKLPHLEEGEWILFENMGAYTMSSACMFNSFRTTKVYYILDKATFLKLKDIF